MGRHALVEEPHDHVVHLYDRDEDVVAAVGCFVAEGLRGEAVVLAITTPAHRDAVEEVLVLEGLDLAGARATGRYVWLDAAETLLRLMVRGHPDRRRFRAVVGALVADAEATGRPVRAFGEMVAVLWDDGNHAAAIELEGLWNELGRDHRFLLYCAYPVDALAASNDLTAAGQVCTEHSEIIPPASYATDEDDGVAEGALRRAKFFVPDPTAIRAVRRFVSRTLTHWAREELIDDAVLVASELATNALRHARSPFVFTLEQDGDGVRMSLQDVSHEHPVRRDAGPHEVGGRGVALVERLSRSWGTDVLPDGKLVWSELA